MKILDYKSADFAGQLQKACAAASPSAEVSAAVDAVIADVRARGDAAVFAFTKKFDGADICAKNVRVSDAEFKAAVAAVPAADKRAMRSAIACVKKFNARSKPKNWRAKNPHGATVGETFFPIERVGIYIPGGQAPLVSTVVMTATLAKIAGCPEICVCTPPARDGSVNPYVLCALALLGAGEVYKIGGSQAIAAMGVGTESVKKVDKLFGPGNAFVMETKRRLFGEVGCDLLPGPSEVLILADANANARYIAADLLSQAEHGSGREKIFFITTSPKLVREVGREIASLSASLSRAEKLSKIIDEGCYVVEVPSLEAGAKVAEYVAPEHMEIHARGAERLASKITTAGAVLVGENSPTVLGDFTAGPSHTLPTGRTGRFSGGLQVSDFMRRSSYVKYGKKSLALARETVVAFGKMEGLDAHYKSLLERLK